MPELVEFLVLTDPACQMVEIAYRNDAEKTEEDSNDLPYVHELTCNHRTPERLPESM